MHTLSGSYTTEHASKYLQQLCKHFGHKTEVTFSASEGQVQFGFGVAKLFADETALNVRFEMTNAEDDARARHVIDKHLERFAFREGFEHMNWGA